MQSIVHTVDGLADGAGGCGDASDTQPQQIQPEIHFKLGQEQLHLPAPADPAANAAPPAPPTPSAPPACSCFRHGKVELHLHLHFNASVECHRAIDGQCRTKTITNGVWAAKSGRQGA